MNRMPTKEEVQKIVQRWHQLRDQYGDQVVNVPEFTQLNKTINSIKMHQQQLQQQHLQQQQQQQQQQRLEWEWGWGCTIAL